MKKTILITGSSGFIASHLIPLLEKEYKLIKWDIQDGNDIFSVVFETFVKKSDIVIHLAAETSVIDSFNRVKDFMYLNVLGTARVLQYCVKYNKKLIFVSTGAYYNRELSPYAQSKALADDICQSMQKYHPIVILRLFNVFGTNMNEKTGSIIWSFVQGVKKGSIKVYGSGEQLRDFINVKDVALIIKASISSRWNGQIVDVASGRRDTINYVAELFKHFSKTLLVYTDPPKREIKWSIANLGVLKILYKKKLITNLEKDIEEIVKYYDKRIN